MARRVPERRGDHYLPPASFSRDGGFQSPPMGIVPDGRDKGSGYGTKFWRETGFGSGEGRSRGNGGAPPIQNLWPNELYGGGAFAPISNQGWKGRQKDGPYKSLKTFFYQLKNLDRAM